MGYKSAVVGLENDRFDVGARSDPAKFSKLLRNIKNYIQKTYKELDDIVKTIQQMKKADLAYPGKPRMTQNALTIVETLTQMPLKWQCSHGRKTTSP